MRKLGYKVVNKEEDFAIDAAAIPASYSKSRRSFCRSSSSVSAAMSIVISRKSFSYDKLSQAPIHLTVVKLDGSIFEIEVVKMAKISDLKQAVESTFSNLPVEEPGQVSWPHVWLQFCLSFRGQKLLNDSDNMKNYGITDGDVLHFVRLVPIVHNLVKKRSTKHIKSPKPGAMSIQNNEMEMSKSGEDDNDQENIRPQVEENSSHNESHLYRRWSLHSRVSKTENVKLEGKANQSKKSRGFVGCFKSLFPLCENRNPSYSSKISRVDI